ncbi:hypothetical protein Tco_0842739, partial [Tanacetum coccineum]
MEILPVSASNSAAVDLYDGGGSLFQLSFQDTSKYEHVGPKTQDRKKVKYYKDDQVMMKDLKCKVKRQRQRQRKDQDHKSMNGTKELAYLLHEQDSRSRQEASKIKDQNGVGSQRHHIVSIGELNAVAIALMARASLSQLRSDAITKTMTPSLRTSDVVAIICDAVSKV